MIRIGNFKAAVLLLSLWTVAFVPSFAQGTPPGEISKLVAVLNSSELPIFDKAKACQRLVIVGHQSAVPALAELLTDEKLSAYAREALEGIPGPAAGAALREALSRLEGERLAVGASRSIA